ncbi:MAG: SAF domain-containing protein [Propionibacteriaceae bacterium]|nr:SAF domain-containing protein [Propionibacteriaceae bacterium]
MTATEMRPPLTRTMPDEATGRLRARRQPKWIAAGLLAMCLGGLGAAVLWGEASGSAEVLVLTRPVARGEVVTAEDFRVARVGHLDGASSVAAAELPAVAGQQALVDLAMGSLLPAGGVGASALDAGGVQIGLRLPPGRVPLGALPAGTPVLLVPLEDPRANPEAAGRVAVPIEATILAPPQAGPDGVAHLVDVRVDSPQAAQVATLAATDRLALVKAGR